MIQAGEKWDCGMGYLVLNTVGVNGYNQDIYETISDMWNVFFQVHLWKKLLRNELSYLFYITAILM